jgi:hypothetical protein
MLISHEVPLSVALGRFVLQRHRLPISALFSEHQRRGALRVHVCQNGSHNMRGSGEVYIMRRKLLNIFPCRGAREEG